MEILKANSKDGSGKAKTPLGKLKKSLHNFKVEEAMPSNKAQLKKVAKTSELGVAIVDVHPSLTWKSFDHQKYLDIRNAFIDWIAERTSKEIYTIKEANNLMRVMKFDLQLRIKKKIDLGQKLNDYELERMDKLFEHLMSMHKIKHGERKIIQKMDFRFIRDLT